MNCFLRLSLKEIDHQMILWVPFEGNSLYRAHFEVEKSFAKDSSKHVQYKEFILTQFAGNSPSRVFMRSILRK